MPTYLVISDIEVQQIPTDKFKDRKALLKFSFLQSYEATSTWKNLTQTLKLTLPKNVKIQGKTTGMGTSGTINRTFSLDNVDGDFGNLGGTNKVPVFMRGDIIRLNVGYRAILRSNDGSAREETQMTGRNDIPHLFEGVISSVQPKSAFTLECEDWMWLLKQMPTPVRVWKPQSLGEIVKTIIKESKNLPLIQRYADYVELDVSDFSKTDLHFNVRNFTTSKESLAAVLSRLKTEYRVDSYFRKNQLRIGLMHYIPEDTKPHTFSFQKNIVEDKLTWQRKDDIILSTIVKSIYEKTKDGGGTTMDGHARTTRESTEVLVYSPGGGEFDFAVKGKNKEFDPQYTKYVGETFTTLIHDTITDPKKLFEIGKAQLEKYYYEGFKGSFTTFGIPYVKHGDTVELKNTKIPEMEGTYKVKSVTYTGSFDGGLRQEITIDYKI